MGYERGEHGRPAGLRTVMLVCFAASVSMIQVNLLLPMAGRAKDSLVMLDLMRLPLGILSGMGFIGAGAILRRDSVVLGVTTAATLWFVTVMGLCFGGGQIQLGGTALVLGVCVNTGLRHLEHNLRQWREGTLTVLTIDGGPSEQEIRDAALGEKYRINSCCATFAPENTELLCQIAWKARPTDSRIPDFVRALAQRKGVLKVTWMPQTHST
jgi:putative Mg2+ transporter-C (MgtC) family protein